MRAAKGGHPLRSTFIALLGVGVLVAAGAVFSLTTRSITQPIAFNHRLHVEELGAECSDCHLYALTGVRATIPNIQVCGHCHSEALTESAEEARLIEYVEAGDPIPWRRVYWVPDHVYFSHRRHSAAGDIECERCHGAVGERVEPLTHQLVPLTMDGCMDCHDETGTSNDCLLCHR